MSYIVESASKEDYLENLPHSKQNIVKTALNQFAVFTTDVYAKKGKTVLSDVVEISKKERNNEKIYTVLNQYVQWLLVDHLDLKITQGNSKKQYSRPMRARHPETARLYAQSITSYIEEVFRIEVSRTIWKKRIKIPIVEEEDPEPFTPKQMRLVLDHSSPKKKLLYMVLKDSGMRIGECCSLKKKDFDITKNLIEIHIPARVTKTKKSRTTFVTNETKQLLLKKLKEIQDDEIIFATSKTPEKSADAEWQSFNNLRKKIGLVERNQSNGRYKITLHSFRSFTATQATIAVDDSWGHSLLGHKQYLGQYIRNQDEYARFYKRTEPYLMIYEKIEVIESSEKVDKLEKAVIELQRLYLLKEKTGGELRQLEVLKG
jgi:integrase